MAVVVSIARGHDASYPFRTIGAADGVVVAADRGAGYYLSAVEKGGEPAGIWVGNGATELGLLDGDVVRREDFEPLYGDFLDPRDPSRQTYLGRPPRVNAELSALYQAKLAAHPGATAGERMRLLAEARSEYEGPVGVQYFDTTFSVDKTISLAHASALASAVEARQAGDLRRAVWWEERAAGIWEEIDKAVRLYVGYVQREAGFVRTGHHGRRIGEVEAGRFEDAREIPVAIFPQHTSRNGDPQLHVHVLWLNKVQTVRDGQWRAIDSRGMYREKGAASALAAFALESGLARRFGFGWAYRPASKGRVIAGFPEQVIAQFSSRRAQITAVTAALVEEYEQARGHAPDQRALGSMRQFANRRTRRVKQAGALDFGALLREWEKTSRETESGSLRELARLIWPSRADAELMQTRLAAHGELTHAQERAVMAAGVAQAQVARAAWSRADLVHCIGQNLPDHAIGRDQQHAWQLLASLADRALAGEGGEEVVRLDAPEWPRVPDFLRRADGENVYRAHGTELYATRSQLAMEEQLLADAQREAAPHLTREEAAALLGADLAQLEAQLRAHAPAAGGTTGCGLRLDQATAAFVALTSPRRAELIVGPAGTGKTYTAVRIAAAWRAAGRGQVVGIATTSAGRNVLIEAGIPVAENTAQFLGHLPGRRGARGVTRIGSDALLILDEASMTSMADLAATLRHAARSGAKVIITGDHEQLAAVEAGGGMAMLARQLGYAQLTEAMRFASSWEGRASLGIRAGELSALGVYDEQGRLHGGSYEQMAEQACRAYLAEYLAGVDVILTAYQRRECLDLSRRVQGYLLDWGQLQPGTTAGLREGACAYGGDLIVARDNDNRVEAGQPGRMLANGDVLRVEAIGPQELTVRRLAGHDRVSGQQRWSAPFAISRTYAHSSCDLGYALTWHTVEGRTVSAGITLASDARSRDGLYVAMTRGERDNQVYAYPSAEDPETGVPGQGPVPDPEVARQRRLHADRDRTGPASAVSQLDAIAILAQVVRRGPDEWSATETREQALSDADHLGTLHAIWQDQCRADAVARYEQAVRQAASPADAEEILADTDKLWRVVQAAELAGRDGAQVIQQAVEGRSFTGARSHSAVLTGRIRKASRHLPPQTRGSWTASLPQLSDPELARYLGEIAAAMDDRQRRIGEHAARERPVWAVRALGEIPSAPGGRPGWERKAGWLGAYREISGWDHPDDAIGPEPAATSPEVRAVWHAAFAALGTVEGIDVRHLTDGQLLARSRAYQAETTWSPKYVAGELRAARRQERFSRVEATRHAYEATAAARRGEADQAALHQAAARSWTALGQRTAQVREALACAHDTWCEWEAITEPSRRLARASDIELKRRGVLDRDDVLVSAEPAGFVYPEPSASSPAQLQLRLDGGTELAGSAELASPAEREERALEVLGLTLVYDDPELPAQVRQIAEFNRQRQAEISQRRTQQIAAREPGELELGAGQGVLAGRSRDAVIQPPRPPVPAAAAVLEHTADREAGG